MVLKTLTNWPFRSEFWIKLSIEKILHTASLKKVDDIKTVRPLEARVCFIRETMVES